MLYLYVCNVHVARTIPSTFFFFNAVSVNGSSITGNCYNDIVENLNSNPTIRRCDAPLTSVLFDGDPTFTGPDGDTWASPLLVLKETSTNGVTIFDFTMTPGYQGVEAIKLVVFNCPKRGIEVQAISVFSTPSLSSRRDLVASISIITITSCFSLVQICIMLSTRDPVLILQFSIPGSIELYLAETTFFTLANNSDCILSPTNAPTTEPTTNSMFLHEDLS